ncbi:G-type lectin S-receptor-like serine threonine-kinase At4g27290 isoform X1 [Olea europaea subsp. europaea]|uniref:non-specific serine/threonine protein kinase n=1 Tax=Olea europaea subsp. europaea TaxID=158383 RepID=A0A8S0PWJ5_OLEEU|nr:G-type lectin S-receptor-like serine threonine-kinase At4g27290 isoform X1 [Olea europaea subsp. europaea]
MSMSAIFEAIREIPLTNKSGVLKVIEPGLLVLLNDTNGVIIWSSNTSRPVKTAVAKLLDSGNLVVKDANDDDPVNFLWESFNYPTDTLLPVISSFTLNTSGIAQRWTWIDQKRQWVLHLTAPTDNCDTYKNCGAYGSYNIAISPACGCLNRFLPKDPEAWKKTDWSNGCVRRNPLNCQTDVYLKYSGIKLPDTRYSWHNETLTLKECKIECLNNCTCTAYTYLDISRGGSGCLIWFGDLIDIKELSADGQDIYIRMSSSESGRKREILLVSFSLCMGIILLGLSMILYVRKRKKINQRLRGGGLGHNFTDNHHDESHNKDIELPLFDVHTITKVTDNFSINNKLGEGGFGPVYKGRLEEGQEVAVKRLSRTSLQGFDEFKNEVICIAKLQDRNLVNLLGCCIQGEEKMLIYEYLTNRSLDLILFDPMKSAVLDWSKRFHIINGVAKGLIYQILARSFGGNETGPNMSRVVGTYGYMSPKYAADGVFSIKSDVFSIGVPVLEIVSGKKNRGFYHKDHHLNLLGHAWRLYKEGRSLELVQAYPSVSGDLSEVLRLIHVGLLCVQQCPEDRLKISSIVLMLGNEVVLPDAKKPGFFTERDLLTAESSTNTNVACSMNEMTITLLDGR